MPKIDNRAKRWLLSLLTIALTLVSAAAFLLGAMMTLFACSPANTADADALIRGGPPFLLGGLMGLLIARRLWRAIQAPSNT